MKCVCVLAFAIALPVCVFAQQSKLAKKSIEFGSKSEEKQTADDLERAKAISLIERTAAEAPLWDNKKMAVQVMTDAADLLWEATPDQGANCLKRAWALIDQVSETPKNNALKDFFIRSDKTELQTAVLSVARRRDPEMAEKFLEQLTEKKADDQKDRGAFDDRTARSEQLLRLAQQAADTNPELAFSLAEASLADGLSYTLQDVLTGLRKKRIDLSNRLFDLALARFRSTVGDASEAEVLAGYLFRSGVTFSANSSGQTILVVNPMQENAPAVAPQEPQRTREFLIAVYEELLARPVSADTPEGRIQIQRTLVLGDRLAAAYYTFAPECAQPAQGFLTQLHRQLLSNGEVSASNASAQQTQASESSTKRLTSEEIYEKRLSELEEKADKETNPIARNLACVAAALAAKPEDYQRAKRIAEKIADTDFRADAVSFVLYRAALFFVDKAKIEKAADLAPQITEVTRRAVVKIAIAQRLLTSETKKTAPGELGLTRQRAFDLLNDVGRDLSKAEPSVNVAKILLGRIAVLAKLDPTQAFASLEQVVQMISKLERFDLRDSAAPDLGLGTSATSGATVARPRIGFDFRSAIDPMITNDFDQVASVVGKLTPKEVAGVGRLEAAKSFLQKNK